MGTDISTRLPDEFVEILDDNMPRWGHTSRAGMARAAIIAYAQEQGIDYEKVENNSDNDE